MTEKHRSPAFQFYVQDFVTGTMDFTALEIGAYILLLCRQWDKDGLPNDPDKLRTIARCDMSVINVVIEKFELCSDGRYRNARLEKIRNEQIENRLKKSAAGISGNKIRWGDKSQDDQSAITESRSSTSTSVINKESGPDFFYMGTQLFKSPASKFMQDHMPEFLNSWQMKNPAIKVADVFKIIDKERVGFMYTDERHIQNTFNKTAKDMSKVPFSRDKRTEQVIKASVPKRVDVNK